MASSFRYRGPNWNCHERQTTRQRWRKFDRCDISDTSRRANGESHLDTRKACTSGNTECRARNLLVAQIWQNLTRTQIHSIASSAHEGTTAHLGESSQYCSMAGSGVRCVQRYWGSGNGENTVGFATIRCPEYKKAQNNGKRKVVTTMAVFAFPELVNSETTSSQIASAFDWYYSEVVIRIEVSGWLGKQQSVLWGCNGRIYKKDPQTVWSSE